MSDSSSSSSSDLTSSDDSESDGKFHSTRHRQRPRKVKRKMKTPTLQDETTRLRKKPDVESRPPPAPRPPPPPPQQPRGNGGEAASSTASFFFTGMGIIVVVGFFLLTSSMGWLWFKPDPKHGWNQELLVRLEGSIDKLSAAYPSQREASWDNIFETVRQMRHPQERQPAVLLWIPLKGASKTLDCVANRTLRSFYSDVVSKDAAKWIISSDSLPSGDASQSRTALDEKLSSVLGNPSLPVPVVLLKGVDRLPPAAASLLSKYCRRETAWRPKSIIMLTLSEELSNSNIDLVHKVLRDRWPSPQDGLNQGQVDALLSQITIAPLYIERESDATLQTNCP